MALARPRRPLTGQGASIDTTTPSGKLVFGIFASLTEFERDLISERTRAGLASARARGRRPKSGLPQPQWEDLSLGIGPWSIRTFDASNLSDTTYRGTPAQFSYKFCLANSVNMNWEVIEPLSGPSIYRDFLQRRGDGIQHVAFDLGGIPYGERLSAMRERGYELVQSGVISHSTVFHYYATEADAHTIIEVYDFPSGATLPEPEAWYPGPPSR